MQTSSVDKQELKKFNKTTKEWWSKEGEFKMLHEITPLRTEYIQSVISRYLGIKSNDKKHIKQLKLIDVGCGGGLVSIPMCRLGFDITALDPSKTNIIHLASYAKDNNLNLKCINSTIEEHVKSDIKYDVVLCLEVVEHVADLKKFVDNLSKLLSPTGILIISTINRTLKSYLHAIIMAEYVLGWIPKKTHNHTKFVKPSEIARILQDTGLTPKEIKGLSLSIQSQKWYLSDDIDVNYFATFKK